jgi:hypothetical protein
MTGILYDVSPTCSATAHQSWRFQIAPGLAFFSSSTEHKEKRLRGDDL